MGRAYNQAVIRPSSSVCGAMKEHQNKRKKQEENKCKVYKMKTMLRQMQEVVSTIDRGLAFRQEKDPNQR